MRRTMHVVEGLGPQDPSSQFDHTQESTTAYDHPYFGQLFLASVLKIMDFPFSLTSSTLDYVQSLYLAPRLIMGILAIVDTFLVYKIGEIRYNRNVAVIAALLFAVMPLTWLLRRGVLDSIQLPFMLLSVLFAVYYINWQKSGYRNEVNKQRILLSLSGMFMGLGIFTKLTGVTMVPLIVYLLTENRLFERSNLRPVLLWLVPVILVPLIWPVYSFSVGDIGEWLDGLSYQASGRLERGLSFAFNVFWEIDPLLLLLGGSGLILTSLRRDFFLAFWIIPYIGLIYLVGWVTHFHWILVFPAFCIGGAFIVSYLFKLISSHTRGRRPLVANMPKFLIIFSILAFGLINNLIMVTTNVSYHQFETAAYIADSTKEPVKNSTDGNYTTIISGPVYSWIFKYPFEQISVLSGYRDSSQPIQSDVIMAKDQFYKGWINRQSGEDQRQIEAMKAIDNQTEVKKVFDAPSITYDRDKYPYNGLGHGRIGASDVEIRANY